MANGQQGSRTFCHWSRFPGRLACDILRLTFASPFIRGRMIGIRLPSTHPNTLGPCVLAGKNRS
jgi:hypothetical protein